ncbi:MAG: hypothetical protein P9L94_09030 [Candidatus Hinthialibacter antarcticus]|nr:hypothetical protein [Candidatus Hinthialibacter antarcticus]
MIEWFKTLQEIGGIRWYIYLFIIGGTVSGVKGILGLLPDNYNLLSNVPHWFLWIFVAVSLIALWSIQYAHNTRTLNLKIKDKTIHNNLKELRFIR